MALAAEEARAELAQEGGAPPDDAVAAACAPLVLHAVPAAFAQALARSAVLISQPAQGQHPLKGLAAAMNAAASLLKLASVAGALRRHRRPEDVRRCLGLLLEALESAAGGPGMPGARGRDKGWRCDVHVSGHVSLYEQGCHELRPASRYYLSRVPPVAGLLGNVWYGLMSLATAAAAPGSPALPLDLRERTQAALLQGLAALAEPAPPPAGPGEEPYAQGMGRMALWFEVHSAFQSAGLEAARERLLSSGAEELQGASIRGLRSLLRLRHAPGAPPIGSAEAIVLQGMTEQAGATVASWGVDCFAALNGGRRFPPMQPSGALWGQAARQVAAAAAAATPANPLLRQAPAWISRA